MCAGGNVEMLGLCDILSAESDLVSIVERSSFYAKISVDSSTYYLLFIVFWWSLKGPFSMGVPGVSLMVLSRYTISKL